MPAPAGTPEPSDRGPPAQPCLCRRCGYDLASLRRQDDAVTCPECGLTGPFKHVVRLSKDPARHRLLLMTGPSILAFSATVAIIALGGGRQHSWARPAFSFFLVAGLLYAVFAPFIFTMNAVRHEPDPTRRTPLLIGSLLTGWGANIAAALLIFIVLFVLSLMTGGMTV